MPQTQKLSELISDIDTTIKNRFGGKTFWIKAEITDVKKQPDKRWCFLKFIEKDGNTITTEMKGVFWANSYNYIEEFEEETQQKFVSGLEITCNVRVRFHKRFGMDLEVLEIDFAYAIGKLERERKQTLERLVNENPLIRLLDGYYSTPNNRAALPMVFQNIALITAPNSDGQRDFTNVIEQNKYGYAFAVTPFLTQVQGDNAPQLIMEQLRLVEASKTDFDVVVIVRGGGSDIDFKSFNDYELARQIALCEKPILTGIGHDRNTSIVDLMARQLKTPTEVAAFILDNNYGFENNLLRIKARILQLAEDTIDNAKDELKHYKQRVKNLNPTTILKKGFAIVYADDKIVVDPQSITTGTEIKMHLQQEIIISTVTKKAKNEKEYDL
jgi:exodeoxyribonuclease VII large subunit